MKKIIAIIVMMVTLMSTAACGARETDVNKFNMNDVMGSTYFGQVRVTKEKDHDEWGLPIIKTTIKLFGIDEFIRKAEWDIPES